ncbi:sulfite exporter TauE/SafE family protein [Allopusillimonas ginsengisoli]|uniref:sulfite exporter TauE/SafE family protein n=1 Tax=Allopusillimonas ginsengisoli TaxID=453575 RepID=UPI00101FD2EB|nr:sulfite exporter TauE/SafE family protein [Allopusillimonas ginsengisoli]TEA78401.1 sulfite exporter TauE/SafE family protein [Allopusillimonas ginsengisoli]
MPWYFIAVGGLLSGALIGFTGGLLGIGGGLLAIPLLGLLLGMDQQMAQGTALIMVLPAVLLTVRKYNQNARIDFHAAAAGAASSIVCTWIGARIALGLDSAQLRLIYAVFVLGIAVFYFYQAWRGARARKPLAPRRQAGEFHKGWFALIGTLAGLAGGIFGVGGSVLVVPLLTTFFRLSQTGAQAIALSMIIPGIFVALFTYASHGQADWLIGIPLALGSILMVPYGVRLAYALPEPRLKLIFACLLVVIMALLLLKV